MRVRQPPTTAGPRNKPMTANQTPWLVVGHGALASLWAHGLARSEQPLHVVVRDTSATKAFKHAQVFTLESALGESEQRQFARVTWSQASTVLTPDTCVLLMLKAWQLEPALAQLSLACQQAGCMPQALIVSHNGLGAADARLAQFNTQVFDLVTTQGAWRRNPFDTVHAGVGGSAIGPRKADAGGLPPVWFEALAAAMPPLSWRNDMLLQRWQKLAINCAINPLASLAGTSNGELAKPQYQATIEAVCDEVAAVAEQVLGKGVLPAELLLGKVQDVIAHTANNTCSMLQDIQQGRPTEIDYLNGYIVRMARQHRIAVPTNAQLTQHIKTRTER